MKKINIKIKILIILLSLLAIQVINKKIVYLNHGGESHEEFCVSCSSSTNNGIEGCIPCS